MKTRLPSCDTGASSVEYALFASLIAAVIALSVGFFGTQTAALFAIHWPTP